MATNRNIIVVEDKLKEMIDVLPNMSYKDETDEFEVWFGFGDEKELNAFLQQSADRKYPLIWLVYPYEEAHGFKEVEVKNMTLVLAVDTVASKMNMDRLDTTYREILFKLYGNLVHCFEKSNTIHIDSDYKIVKFPNYGAEETNNSETVDLWDAMKVVFNCRINDRCLREITF